MRRYFQSMKAKEANRLAKYLSAINGKTYRDNLSMAWKLTYMRNRQAGGSTIKDVNWVKNNIGNVYMWNIKDFHKQSKYTISFRMYPELKVEIKQHIVEDTSWMAGIVAADKRKQRFLD